MASSDNIAIYNWHPFQRKYVAIMSVFSFLCVGGCIFFYTNTSELSGKIVSVSLGSIFLVAAIALLISPQTKINFSTHTLSREIRLFGPYTFRYRNVKFSEFNAVIINKTESEGGCDYLVGLNYLSDRKFWVTYFSNIPQGYPCSRAERLAEQLSSELQMPVKRIA
jgi:hypothetical protein